MSPLRRHVRVGLAAAPVVAAAAVVSITLPAVPTARGGTAASVVHAGCPSLRNVSALTGTVTVALGATATGPDPSSGGSETVYLSSAAKHVTANLDEKVTTRLIDRVLVEFNGGAHGGTVTVDDSFENTGLDVAGEVKAAGAVGGGSIGSSAVLAVDRSVCEYKLLVAFQGIGAFSGDSQAADGRGVSWGAQSRPHAVPADLHFHGSETPKVMPKCPTLLQAPEGNCAEIGGPWLVDLITLDECGSTDLTNCTPDDQKALTSAAATFSWNLKPVYRKK